MCYGVHFDKLSELVKVLVAEPVEGPSLSELRKRLQRSYQGVDVVGRVVQRQSGAYRTFVSEMA